MKFIHKIKSKIFVLVLISFFGCTKDFLDTKQMGVTSTSDFYQTDADAKEALMACYNNMQADVFNWKFMIANLSDDIYAGGGMRGDFAQFAELNEYQFGTSNTTLSGTFSYYYKGIYLSNLVVDNVKPDTKIKEQVIAEAKALRALLYFDLVTLWGPVPLVLHELSPSEYAQPNSTVENLWAQIERDLTEAIAVLPLKSQQSASDKNRISKGTAQALLGKSYLFQKKYNDAITQFESVINSGEYSLYADYSKVFKKDSEFGVESLFELSYTSNVSVTTESVPAFIFWAPRLAWFSPGGSGILPGFGFQVPQKGLYEAFAAAGDDVRRKASIMNEQELIGLGGSMRNSGGTLQYGSEGFVRLKYTTWMSETDMSNPFSAFGTNYRILRYADVLLMAAEAYNRASSPNNAKALTYINLVRDRAKLAPLTSNGDALFADIKKERRLELCFENKRYQDLVRWGDAETVLANEGKSIPKGDGTYFTNSTYGFKAKHKLLPFPETEINVNPNIKQNPGW